MGIMRCRKYDATSRSAYCSMSESLPFVLLVDFETSMDIPGSTPPPLSIASTAPKNHVEQIAF